MSIVLLVQYIAGALFGTSIGHFVDHTSRTFGKKIILFFLIVCRKSNGPCSVVKSTLFVQNLMIVVCSVIICVMWNLYYADHFQGTFCAPGVIPDENDDCTWLWGESTFVCLFVALCLCNALGDLCSTGSSISVERDWVVVLCGTDTELLSGMSVEGQTG